jgi:hypothetical protein
MDSASYGWAAVISGVLGSVMIPIALHKYEGYKRAKKHYTKARVCEVESVHEALSKPNNGKRHAFVKGQIKTNNDVPAASVKYRNQIAIPGYGDHQVLIDKHCEMFELVEQRQQVQVYPSRRTEILHLSQRKLTPYPWYTTLLSVTMGMGMGIALGEEEYLAYDGDSVTIFGVLDYRPGAKELSIRAKYLSSSGRTNMVEVMKGQSSIGSTVFFTGISVLLVGLAAYCTYKAFSPRPRPEPPQPQPQPQPQPLPQPRVANPQPNAQPQNPA